MFIWPKLGWSSCWVSIISILLFCRFYGIKANVNSGLGSSHSERDSISLRLTSPRVTLNDFQMSPGLIEFYQIVSFSAGKLWIRRKILTHFQPVGRTFQNYFAGHIHTRNDLDIAIRPCLRNNTLKAACLWSHLYLLKIQYLNQSLLQYSSSV